MGRRGRGAFNSSKQRQKLEISKDHCECSRGIVGRARVGNLAAYPRTTAPPFATGSNNGKRSQRETSPF